MEVDEPTHQFKRPLTRTNAAHFTRSSSQGFQPNLESDPATAPVRDPAPGTSMGTLFENEENAETSASPAADPSPTAARPSSILLNRDGSRRRSRNRKPSTLHFSEEVEASSESKRQSPSPVKTRRMNDFDPYQVFQVEHRSPMMLRVDVVRGENITIGWRDILDTPDPYIQLKVPNAPEGRKRTRTIDNDCNPVWNETFFFYLDYRLSNTLELTLMEANYTYDETLGTEIYSLSDLTIGETKEEVVRFNDGANGSVFIRLMMEEDKNPTLRYSLCLCDDEKAYREKRKAKTFQAMNELLGEKGPKDMNELPTVAVIGSGGGFRAMTAYSGVFKALYDSKILDCVTYAAGLSGSSWYLSTLYSHPDWPHISPSEVQQELKTNIQHSILYLLKLPSIYRYVDRILQKRRQGQPVSFTDFFGHMVGETLLKGRLDSRLTDQRERINGGDVPMPLYTCVHVKKDVPARSFQEWVEFSPYEIGLPKYGTFMDSKLFGSKFFMGHLVKQYPEQPLHFLQGIWGSAFCILLRRMMEDNSRVDPVEMIRQELEKEVDEDGQEGEESDLSDDESDDPSEESDAKGSGSDEASATTKRVSFAPGTNTSSRPRKPKNTALSRKPSVHRTNKRSFWSDILTSVFESQNISLLNSRAGRAAVIHNFMRGLSLTQSYPISPFTPYHERVKEGDEFDGNFEMHPTDVKHIYMVDAGLTFNSPYPLVLRGQRNVDIIISFDFSARPTDNTPPFKELILAEKWARINKIPFPPIDPDIVAREGLKELYIFRHPTDPYCPIVLHFPLVNIAFRHYKAPGVPRETQEERDFANFDLFDDPNTPYSTFNFKYSNQQFDRLAQLTEFNTLLHVEDIKKVLAEVVEQRRLHPPRLPIASKNIKLLRIKSIKERRRLKKYLTRMESAARLEGAKPSGEAQSPTTPATPATPFYPAADHLSPDSQDPPQGVVGPTTEGEKGESEMQEGSEDMTTCQLRPKFRRQSTMTSVNDITRSLSLKSPTLQDSVDSQDSGTDSWTNACERGSEEDDDDDDDDDDIDDDDDDPFYDALDQSSHDLFQESTRL